jgi:superfamily II DNA or RNA helicase
MQQHSLFRTESSGTTLRDYQAHRAEQAVALLRSGQSVLSVMATGTGKTVVGASIVHAMPGRWLWVAHRIELVKQAKAALERLTGEHVEEETPGKYSSDARIVVASKDTVRTAKRLDRLKSYGRFDGIVFDECHHSPAASYQVIVRAYPGAVCLGLTATPGRMDGAALKLFNARTDPYGIVEASKDAWLVPIVAKRARIKTIDVSGISTTAGDFTPSELRDLLASETNLTAMVAALRDSCGDRPTIAYAVSVDVAQKLAELMGPQARVVHGGTEEMLRAELFRDFGKRYQYLFNVAVATEGTDLPAAACIAMCRPTKSESLFQQMLGRGLRPEPGLTGKDSNVRRDWISNSRKPDCLVLDFVGNTGKHSVATAVDLFTTDKDVRERVVKRLAADETLTIAEVVELETARVAKVRAVREHKAKLKVEKIDTELVDTMLIGMGGEEWSETQDLTSAVQPKQLEMMRKLGIPTKDATTAGEARRLIMDVRKLRGLASPKQLDFLRKHKPSAVTENLQKKTANFLISQLIRGWKGGNKWHYRSNTNTF